MKLLWCDLETNGLDQRNDRILEVAAFVTDLATPWTMEGEPVQGVLPITLKEAGTYDEFITTMHTKNGLLVECFTLDLAMKEAEDRAAAVNTDNKFVHGVASPQRNATWLPFRYTKAMTALEDRLLALIPDKDVVGKENVTALAGSSVHFDLGFLRTYMPRLSRQLSHRCYDVSAVKLFCRSLGMPKLPPEEAHRALPDIRESMRHAQLCASWCKNYGVQAERVNALTINDITEGEQ